MEKYIIYIGLAILVIIICLIAFNKLRPKSDEVMYEKFMKKIFQAFDKILINVTDIPKLDKKTLVRLNHIDDLVDISERVRKPIYYFEVENACDFMLLNDNEYCIYTLRANDNYKSKFDNYLLDYAKNNNIDNSKMLENLSDTAIIKIEDGAFKVTRINHEDLLDDEEITIEAQEDENGNMQKVEKEEKDETTT